MGGVTWPSDPDDFIVFGPDPWEEALMGSHEGFRRVETLEVDFLIENEDVRRSPRGWSEASIRTAIARDVGDHVEFAFDDGAGLTRVSKAALRAMLKLGERGETRPPRDPGR